MFWTGAPTTADASARNAVLYGEKAIDRSPCGTGTSARMAQWAALGKLQEGGSCVHESIIGSPFTGRVEALTRVGDKAAIVPSYLIPLFSPGAVAQGFRYPLRSTSSGFRT